MIKRNTEASARKFFKSRHYAVVGANSNPQRFGNKVLLWYQLHQLPVTPIHPREKIIETSFGQAEALQSISELSEPRETSVSIITPPPATLQVLKEAKRLGIPAVWLQPGTYDDEVMKFAHGGETGGYAGEVIAGEGGNGSEGWCILVDGETYMKA
ncbi:CoA binding domain-containing protein [Xylaria nigripes]|nr:CoA binding domain-containing protein [Xylaria nigripes]